MAKLIEIAETWIDEENIDSIDVDQDQSTMKWYIRVRRKQGRSVFCSQQFGTKDEAMQVVRASLARKLS